jgi:2-keto-4-pentenoate hydratase/2-oxohepta-3-ene-1,7-dioic acid hydratase in catechol pathway
MNTGGRVQYDLEHPSKILCVGFNYPRHSGELGYEQPKEPVIFLKPRSALTTNKTPVVYPSTVRQLDYEGELVVVIGRRCRRVSEADALEYVGGYKVGNDFTARDQQLPTTQWTFAKGYDGFCALSSPAVQHDNWRSLRLQTHVNGELRQDALVGQLIFPIEYLISYISERITLEPCDVLMTGTPTGVGPLQVGDHVRVSAEGVGEVENWIVADNDDVARDAEAADIRP